MASVKLNPKLRWLFRPPACRYRWNCGWLLGHRFVLLGHVGRASGCTAKPAWRCWNFAPTVPRRS